MAKTKARTRKLTVLLIRETIKKYSVALKDIEALTRYDLKDGIQWSGALFVSKTTQRQPSWRGFLEPVVNSQITGLYNAATSAVLFVRAKGRLFAFTFGYGRNLLDPLSFEFGFGLKAALNRIDHEQIRSLDIRAYEDMVVSTRKQTSRNTEVGSFGLDVARDLVRAVTGEPIDREFATRITGSDSLTINAPITAGGLRKKCEAILDAYQDDKYRKHFDWIDHLDEVRDQEVTTALETQLLEALEGGETDKLHLAPADTVEWQEVDAFRISGAGQTDFSDLDIDEYLSAIGEAVSELTIDKLRRANVRVRWAGSEQFSDKWPLYRCIVWETTLSGELYALVDGKWFRIEKRFANRVKKFVREIPSPATPLPDAHAAESEDAYNQRIAAANSEIILLDKKLVKPLDAATNIEFCDLLSKELQLIHVKKKTRSATLSHLFSQGTVAAQAFVQDKQVRDEVREHIREDTAKRGFLQCIPESRPSPSDYEVVFAIIIKPRQNWPASLPFFSQLNLMQHSKLLEGLGFRVALQQVQEV